MPKFLDHHSMPTNLPPEMLKQIRANVQAGKADQFGVKPINVIVTNDGEGYCLSEGPNAEAVIKSHQSLGFKVGKSDVKEVTTAV